jgi:hypothetical protein
MEELRDKFCEEVGTIELALTTELAFCDFTSENMTTWTAKNAKTKRIVFILKIFEKVESY